MSGRGYGAAVRLAARLICLVLLFSVPAPGGLGEETAEGSVRVLMTQLALTDTAKLLLDGSYTCGEMAFQQGSEVTLQVRDGSIFLFYSGMVRDMGKQVTFERHLLPDRQLNGIRVNGAYPLYCGDLLFDVAGGLLRCVARLEVEEYLLGVLPYEMSSAFPVEALKAQAVAARTYALTHLYPDRAYDVEDNTNDQVYGGITSDTSVIRKAVRDTEGICAFYQGQMVPCYYGASNGGLVESIEKVWGTGNVHGYIRRKNDPYDLNNPESPVMVYSIPKQWKEDASGELLDFLRPRLQKELTGRGVQAEAENIRVREVTAVSLDNPTDAGSRIYQTLKITVLVSVRRTLPEEDGEEELTDEIFPEETPEGEQPPSDTEMPESTKEPAPENTPQPAPESTPSAVPAPSPSRAPAEEWRALSEPVTLSIPYFGEAESAFSLSINGSNNELVTVRETGKAFVLEARRFGHGVGMSQRGAQWMAAKEGWSYRQILHFYYPDAVLKRVRYTYRTADTLTSVFLSTPAPPATPTPRPTLMPVVLRAGERKVIVDRVSTDSTLNLRKEANTTSEVLTRLYYGQELAVMEDLGDWLHVRTESMEGYVMKKYVSEKQEETDAGSEDRDAVH